MKLPNDQTKVNAVRAREILDSRGYPTVEVEVTLKGGATGRAAVPSGASTGTHEAIELRDQDAKRYLGRGVKTAVCHVEEMIGPALVGLDAAAQAEMDQRLIELDGTTNKQRLGANATLGVSLSLACAVAKQRGLPLYQYLREVGDLSKIDEPQVEVDTQSDGKPLVGRSHKEPSQARLPCLPVPFLNLINGGAHANNGIEIQEFMVVPCGFPNFHEALRAGAEVYHQTRRILSERSLATSVGDEGGFAPRVGTPEEVLEILLRAIEKAGYRPLEEVALALDVAASEFYDAQKKVYQFRNHPHSSKEMVSFYEDLCKKYPIISIEDGMAEDDWEGWRHLTRMMGKHIQLVGDDLFVTNPARLKQGIQGHVANAVLIKPNQIGTLTETIRTIQAAQKEKYGTMISHRSGETEDTFIADLAVGLSAGQMKAGAPCRGERTSKYNQLLRIEQDLGKDALFTGKDTFRHQ